MSYHNPLHTPVRSGQVSGFSTLNGAIAPNSARTPTAHHGHTHDHSCHRRVPQTVFAPNSKGYSSRIQQSPLHRPIVFEWAGFSQRGVSIREVAMRGPQALARMMQGANDLVFAHTPQLRKITLHIRWPGYDHTEWIRNVDIMTPYGPLSRGQLAGIIAENFSRYIEKVQYEGTTEPKWRLGAGGGIKLEEIILFSLTNVFENVWQADVAVERH